MEVRKAIVWSLVNAGDSVNWHPSITPDERKISGTMPIVSTLFPGINYYSMSGFAQVMRDCAIPALKKLHPELINATANSIGPDEMVELTEFLPSEGYEWQDSNDWQSKFGDLLAA